MVHSSLWKGKAVREPGALNLLTATGKLGKKVSTSVKHCLDVLPSTAKNNINAHMADHLK